MLSSMAHIIAHDTLFWESIIHAASTGEHSGPYQHTQKSKPPSATTCLSELSYRVVSYHMRRYQQHFSV